MTKRRSRPARRGPGSKPSRPAPQGGPQGGPPGAGGGSAELKKQRQQERREQRREQQRAARTREQGQRRSLEGLQQEALKKQREHEQRKRALRALEQQPQLEHEASRKAYYREFRRVVDAADVVLQVLDARDPQGCRCAQVEQAVLQAGKKLVLVLNKIDLVPRELVRKWLAFLRRELPTVAFKASTQPQNRHLQQSRVPAARASARLLATGACVGADCLLSVLANYSRSRDLRTAIRVGVVGLPNVGKSSLINSLKRARACSVGAAPGVTRCLQEVHLDRHVTLLDSPGLVLAAPASDTALVLRHCLRLEQLADPVAPVEAVLRRCSRPQLCDLYGVPDFGSAAEFLRLLARRLGCLKKGGAPDSERAARAVLSDWVGGKISYFTQPPEEHQLPAHISAEIVSEMGKAFDLEALERGDEEVLASLPERPGGPEPVEMEEAGEEEEFWDAREDLEDIADEQPDPQLGAITVQLRGRKSKKSTKAEHKRPPAPRLEGIRALDPLQQGQGLAAARKRKKKQQKRADKLATKLSNSLLAALNLSADDA